MIQHPGILALLTTALLNSLMLVYASWHGIRILRSWDLASGSELQMALERRTYLITTILGYALFFQILSLFLFIYTADDLHTLFSGAMCAAGSLQVNRFGYPTLVLKTLNCLLAGIWLLINHADNKGYDYPLIRPKYLMLSLLTLLILLESGLLISYVLQLKGDLITSCCGSLFSAEHPGITGEIAGLPVRIMVPWFTISLIAAISSCCLFVLTGRGGYGVAITSGIFLVTALAAIISFISLYFYELPTHHCPFCILQKEYHGIGYPLYAALLGSSITGISVGFLMPARRIASLAPVLTDLQRRLALISLVLLLAFSGIVGYRILTTSFRLIW